MIANIQQPFMKELLERKIEYQEKKIESGLAVELYNSTGETLDMMYHNMVLVSGMNDRVKLPFIEFVISSPIGEELLNDQYLEITQEYLRLMGYNDACYTIIKNDDKENKHVHVYATTMTMEDGVKIDDSNNYARSNAIMRSLENKHGLQVVEKGKSFHGQSLGEAQYRKYYFDSAIHNALRSHNAKARITKLLNESDSFNNISPDMGKAYSNSEWQIILGEEKYDQILSVLSKGKFINTLFKDELLSVMDRLYPGCKDANEFKQKMIGENYYMRLVSDKDKSYYVYGIPDRSLYFKDYRFPERYRFGKMSFDGKKMSPDEQKHYLYNRIFATLHESSNYDDLKERLAATKIKLIEYSNKNGIYGLSFIIEGIESPVQFKASDISARLSYKNVCRYFEKSQTTIEPGSTPIDQPGTGSGTDRVDRSELEPGSTPIDWPGTGSSGGKSTKNKKEKMSIEAVTEQYAINSEEWNREADYMNPLTIAMATYLLLDNNGKKHKNEDDDLPNKKKKKKRNKGLSM